MSTISRWLFDGDHCARLRIDAAGEDQEKKPIPRAKLRFSSLRPNLDELLAQQLVLGNEFAV